MLEKTPRQEKETSGKKTERTIRNVVKWERETKYLCNMTGGYLHVSNTCTNKYKQSNSSEWDWQNACTHQPSPIAMPRIWPVCCWWTFSEVKVTESQSRLATQQQQPVYSIISFRHQDMFNADAADLFTWFTFIGICIVPVASLACRLSLSLSSRHAMTFNL